MDNEDWRIIVEFKEPRIKEIVADNGFKDQFLISPAGSIVYSAAKGSDLGMNLADTELVDSDFGKAFEVMKQAGDDDVVIGDFAAYVPDNGSQTAFMVARMKNEGGNFVGNVGIRISTDRINAIVQQRSGMGETGESYLVGQQEGKISLRGGRVIEKGKIGDAKSDAFIELALNGQSGSAVKTGSTGAKEFVRYDPVTIDDIAQNSEKARAITESAVSKAGSVSLPRWMNWVTRPMRSARSPK